MTEMTIKVESGELAFVPCQHHADTEYSPANVMVSEISHVVTCALCLTLFPTSEIVWVSEQEARQRFGWSRREEDSTST